MLIQQTAVHLLLQSLQLQGELAHNLENKERLLNDLPVGRGGAGEGGSDCSRQ